MEKMMMGKKKAIDWIALAFTVIGGLNWGLVGFLQMDLVAMVFGDMMYVSKAIYILVGISAAYIGITAFRCSKSCM